MSDRSIPAVVGSGLEDHVDAFEAACARGGRAAIEAFLPPREHPQYLDVLCELLRIDLERRADAGEPATPEEYRERFPAVFAVPRLAEAIAFEADRLRRQVAPPPADALQSAARSYRAFRSRPGGDGADALGATFAAAGVPPDPAALFRDLYAADPERADRLADAVAELPRVGARFLGFRLESELGRGAFGRVFLARQGDLADRPVALKVSADVGGEDHALAQLQHTNIVPIYSVHRAGALRAVCMPFLGSVTLAGVLGEIRRSAAPPASGAALVSSLPGEAAATAPAAPAAPARAPHQVETLRRLGYVPAVLWIGRRLAEGLAHAHERGILHHDLKPANILLSDDGEPVLLDFNLAADTKRPAAAAGLGGTLPYMAPEHLAAFLDDSRAVDARGDLFALGVILFELLTGRHPYPLPRGPAREAIPAMIAEREGPPPSPRAANVAVSPAVDAIVRRCLDPEPSRRYASARDLAEDLQRQLDHLPLKHIPEPSLAELAAKWARRHPRLTSTTAVAALAAVLVAGVLAGALVQRGRLRRFEAVAAAQDLQAARDQAQFLLVASATEPAQRKEGLALCEAATRPYGALRDPSWLKGRLVASLPPDQRERARAAMGELLFLWARAELDRADDLPGAAAKAPHLARAATLLDRARSALGGAAAPRAVVDQEARMARLQDRDADAERLRRAAEAIPSGSPRDRLLAISDRLDPAQDAGAVRLIREITERSPDDAFPWLLLGDRYARLGQLDDAIDSLGIGIARRPDQYWAAFLRGTLELDRRRFARARADFDRVLALRPDFAAAWVNRGLARLGGGDAHGAEADLTAALSRRDVPTRAYFIRARARRQLGNNAGAAADEAEGLRRRPADEASWVARGLARLPADPQGALADFREALALNPRSRAALQDTASVLSEQLGQPDEAIRTLDTLLRVHPRAVEALTGRGVLLARQGRREAAHRDAARALELDASPAVTYPLAGLYAQTARTAPEDAARALDLLADALRRDPSWLAVVPRDTDLDPVRDRPEFRRVVDAAAALTREPPPAARSAEPS